MAVRIRMKKLGRLHRPFYRICAMDSKAPRGGRVLQELGTYDPMIPYTDARVTLNVVDVEEWIKKGALPTPKVAVLIKKYGLNGTHLAQQQAAQAKLAEERKPRPNICRVYVAPTPVEESVTETAEVTETVITGAPVETAAAETPSVDSE